MKYLLCLTIFTFLSACSSNHSILNIPSNQSIEIDYPDYDYYTVNLKNKSNAGLGVAVLLKDTEEQIKGFGLSPNSREELSVDSKSKLVLSNKSCLLYTSPSPRDRTRSRMPSSA